MAGVCRRRFSLVLLFGVFVECLTGWFLSGMLVCVKTRQSTDGVAAAAGLAGFAQRVRLGNMSSSCESYG